MKSRIRVLFKARNLLLQAIILIRLLGKLSLECRSLYYVFVQLSVVGSLDCFTRCLQVVENGKRNRLGDTFPGAVAGPTNMSQTRVESQYNYLCPFARARSDSELLEGIETVKKRDDTWKLEKRGQKKREPCVEYG